MGYYDENYYDDYDPPTDECTTLRCPNPECEFYYDPEGPKRGWTWHPRTFSEWQGTREQGGPVNFYEDNDLYCEICNTEAEEL